MNVYEKLNKARLDFQKKGVKQNGKNTYAGYTYFELADILPVCNEICNDVKATVVVKFDKDLAFLEFVDVEKPEDRIIFSSPMSEASLKGCHAVQNLGAVETYIKRYLYQNCFEIAESDVCDATMNPQEKVENKPADSKEFDSLVKAVNSYMESGVLAGDTAKRAGWYISKKDVDGLKRTIEWCNTQVK